MKKIITLIAAAAMLAVSCQKEVPGTDNTGSTGNQTTSGKLTATIAATKVSYAETPELNLQPSWEIGDKIIGFDDQGNAYTLTVASVSAQTATLSGNVPDGALHLIYKSGASASDIKNKALAVDYTAQKGDKTMPAVMLADGTVKDGGCNFTFSNAGAIIGISAVKGVPEGSTITEMTIKGKHLSAATVTLYRDALKLTATTKDDDAISIVGHNLTVTDANGTLSTPILLAVPALARIKSVTVPVPKEPETMTIPSTAADKKGIDYVEIEAKYDGTNLSTKKWAKWNVGANSQSDYGWYFPWSNTEGYVKYADKGLSAKATSVVYSYSLSSENLVKAGDYVYVKEQSFRMISSNFNFSLCPYNPGSEGHTWTKYIPSDQASYWVGEGSPDNKLVLDPEDDAARVNWSGTWRMPTSAEFQALKDATYWAWDATDKGYYVFAPDATHKAGKEVYSFPGDLSKSSSILFFPTAGFGEGGGFRYEGARGYYWSSSLDSSAPNNAYSLSMGNFDVETDYLQRFYGCSVRPISD